MGLNDRIMQSVSHGSKGRLVGEEGGNMTTCESINANDNNVIKRPHGNMGKGKSSLVVKRKFA